MNQMIRNFQLVYIKLICLAILTSANGKTASETRGPEEISPVYTVANKKFEFNESLNYFIVLVNDHYCINCFHSLNDFVENTKQLYGKNYFTISECDSGSLERKMKIAETKKLLPVFDEFLLQYNSSYINFFKKFEVHDTPEILIYSKGKLTRIPYTDIFDFETMKLSTETQYKISKLLNED